MSGLEPTNRTNRALNTSVVQRRAFTHTDGMQVGSYEIGGEASGGKSVSPPILSFLFNDDGDGLYEPVQGEALQYISLKDENGVVTQVGYDQNGALTDGYLYTSPSETPLTPEQQQEFEAREAMLLPLVNIAMQDPNVTTAPLLSNEIGILGEFGGYRSYTKWVDGIPNADLIDYSADGISDSRYIVRNGILEVVRGYIIETAEDLPTADTLPANREPVPEDEAWLSTEGGVQYLYLNDLVGPDGNPTLARLNLETGALTTEVQSMPLNDDTPELQSIKPEK